jgi:hypothetical protein
MRGRVPDGNPPSHRVADERDRAHDERVEEGGEVVGVVVDAVRGRLGPRALAVSAQVGREDAPAGHERGDQRVPPVRMPAVPVYEDDARIPDVAPDEAVEIEPTRANANRARDHVQSSRKRCTARGTTAS